MLLHIGQLQRITYLAHFDKDQQAGNPRKGWAEVLVLRDLAKLMPVTEAVRSEALHDAWSANWSGLGGDDDMAVAAIDNAITICAKMSYERLRLPGIGVLSATHCNIFNIMPFIGAPGAPVKLSFRLPGLVLL